MKGNISTQPLHRLPALLGLVVMLTLALTAGKAPIAVLQASISVQPSSVAAGDVFRFDALMSIESQDKRDERDGTQTTGSSSSVKATDPLDSHNVELVGQIGGKIYAVAVQGNYAYIGVGLRLVILSIADPAHPIVIGQTADLPIGLADLAVAGNYAYVADWGGLRVFNVANPAAPAEVGFYDTPGTAHDVALTGSYAYVADGDRGLRVINVANPAAPAEVGFYDTPGYALGVAVAGGYAYVADQERGLRVINVANPAAPTEVGFRQTFRAMAVAVANGYAYLADEFNGLRVIRVTNPAVPVEISAVSGLNAYDVMVRAGYAYVAYERGLGIINIANPAAPVLVGLWRAPGFATDYELHVALIGDHAYLTHGESGLRVISITDPTRPMEIGLYDTLDSALSVAEQGGYVFAADERYGLRVIDVANPAVPVEVGFYDTPGRAYDVALAGSYAYVADYDRGLRVINVANPAAPAEVGFYDTPGYAYDVALAGSYAYVADYDRGLHVINVANPAVPVEVGFYDTPGHARGVTVAGSYAYVADEVSGLRVINVENPAAPVEVGFYDTPGSAQGVAVAGNYAYVADNSRGLRVINVANPATPTEVGFYDTPGYAYDVALAGSYAYVVDYNRGLRVINVANPAAPTEVGFYDTLGYAQGVTVAGGYVHVVAYGGYVNGGGLFVLRFTGVTYTISGRVTDASGYGILGVTVWAGSPRNTTTDANGDYTFTGLPAGTYGIRPDKDPYVFSPAFRTVTLPPNASGINFAAQPPDLRVAHIEVAQVFVEERDPTSQTIIPLIAKKDTLVRVFVGVSGAPSVYGVTAHLHMRNAFGVERTITQSVNPWPVQAGQNPDPNHLQDTINFRPPLDLLLGNMTFWATVDPNNYIVESDEDNNIGGNIVKPFRSGQPTGDPLRIAWMSLGYANLQAPFIHLADPSIAARGDKALRQIYPVGAGDVEYFFQPGFSEALSVKLNGHEASYRRAANRFWNDVSRSSGWVGGTPDRLYAWIPGIARDPYETCGVADPVWDGGNGRVAIGADACDKTLGGAAKNISPDEVMAHEIGHVLNSHDELRHTPNDAGGDCFAATGETGPYPNATPKGSIIAHGLDVVKLKVLDPQHTYDLMSYCKPSWASPTNYERLLGGFDDPPNLNATGTQSVVSIRQLLVSGMVYSPTMQVDLDPFYAVISAVPPSPNMGSDYCLEALAANGSRLDGRCFNLGFDHSEVSLSPSNTPGAEDSFALSIPYPTDTARVVLTHLGASIATRAISAHAPTVRLISPNGGETWVGSGAYTVTWTAGDLDGDPLHFALAYSTDGGASWIPTGLDLTGTQHALDVSMLPGGTAVLLRISATDGVNTTDDISDGSFNVGRKAPRAFILSPEDDAHLLPGAAIWLEGCAFDLEDGTLDDAALRWTSNRDGELGTGKLLITTLSPGEHVITLTATDSDGNTAVATIRLSAGHRLFLPTVSRGH